MTKKDYELIAAVIRKQDPENMSHHWLAREMAEALADTNPLFDAERFIAACEGRDSTDMAGRKVRYSADPLAGRRN